MVVATQKKRALLPSLEIMEKMAKDLSISFEPFIFFRKNNGHEKSIVEKSKKLNLYHFIGFDENTIRYDRHDQFGRPYHRHIYIKPFL